jgi:hypothetical protein
MFVCAALGLIAVSSRAVSAVEKTAECASATSAASPISHDDAMANMFEPDAQSDAAVQRLENWLEQQPAERPRACHVFLLLPLNCGPVCRRSAEGGKMCTQAASLVRGLRSIVSVFRRGEPSRRYPVVILHNDATREQMSDIERVSGIAADDERSTPVAWVRVRFDNGTRPTYIPPSVADFYLKYHRDAVKFSPSLFPGLDASTLTLAHPRSHGWGYVMMCRLFAGLVFFAPPLKGFKYFMRLDAGDSLLTRVDRDPFAVMQHEGLVYGYATPYGEEGCPWKGLRVPHRVAHAEASLRCAHSNPVPAVRCANMRQHAFVAPTFASQRSFHCFLVVFSAKLSVGGWNCMAC